LISFSSSGSDFLFRSYIDGVGFHPGLVNFAFSTLPTIIFFSSLVAVLYHYGILQSVIKFIAKRMQQSLGTSGSETLSVAGNIFLGQTESPLMVRPFVGKMTNSELMAVMTGGFATVSGGVLAIYVSWLTDIPGIAGHLLAASVMSAPAALVVAKNNLS
jgi:CNT family concentrative nucleoside transporter